MTDSKLHQTMVATDDQIGLLIDRLPRSTPNAQHAIMRRLNQLHSQSNAKARQEADARAMELVHRKKFAGHALRWANIVTLVFLVLIAASAITNRAWLDASALLVALMVTNLWRYSRLA